MGETMSDVLGRLAAKLEGLADVCRAEAGRRGWAGRVELEAKAVAYQHAAALVASGRKRYVVIGPLSDDELRAAACEVGVEQPCGAACKAPCPYKVAWHGQGLSGGAVDKVRAAFAAALAARKEGDDADRA